MNNHIIYSTDPNYVFDDDSEEIITTPENSKQRLYISLDKKQRAGKKVTIVEGFMGREEDLKALAKNLKQLCGVGGGIKDGYILLQGDFREKVYDFLKTAGYQIKRKN